MLANPAMQKHRGHGPLLPKAPRSDDARRRVTLQGSVIADVCR
ncbi:hypothetical protein BAY1663_02119 [Pseudomonas sp. BAY1663]|nr:hypothetical protein BAY1663_02119 [Pseudomonas sp. BAY1663]